MRKQAKKIAKDNTRDEEQGSDEDDVFKDPFIDDEDDDEEDDDNIEDDDVNDLDADFDKLNFIEDNDDANPNDKFNEDDIPDEEWDKRIREREDIIDDLEVDENEELKEEIAQTENYLNMPEKPYVPPRKKFVAKNYQEELEFRNEAYECFHRLRTKWSCLSFDVIMDNVGAQRKTVRRYVLLI